MRITVVKTCIGALLTVAINGVLDPVAFAQLVARDPDKPDTSGPPPTEPALTAEITEVRWSDGGDGNNGGGGGPVCAYDLVYAIEGAGKGGPYSRVGADGRTEWLYYVTCPGRTAVMVWVPEADQQALRAEARDRVSKLLPAPTMTLTPTDDEFGWIYVQTPTDFRVDPADWQPVSVTARVGPVWLTVTGTPETLFFDPGDPAGPPGVTCSGDGPVAPYVAAVPGFCSYTYRNESSTSPYDGYHFLTSLTTTWRITYEGSAGSGELEALTTTSQQPVAVAAIKALITCTGPRPEQGGCG